MICSFDTNVLVYASDPGAGLRRLRALDLVARGLRSGAAVLLLQTLGEFSHVGLRKHRLPVERVRTIVEAWYAILPVHAAIAADLGAAWEAVDQHHLSFWDALLWATADRVGVDHLLTEDFQDGRVLGRVRFVNPFVAGNAALIDRLLPE